MGASGRTTDHPAATASDRPVRADDLATKRETASFFLGCGSARVLVTALAVLAVARVLVGGVGRGDLLALAGTLALTGTVEWIVHRGLLHAPEDAWTTRTLGTSTGHRRHHLDPPTIEWLLLGGQDAAIFVTAFGLVTASWSLPLMWLTGSALLGPFLTAWALAALALLHYEWVHLLVHTRYRPRTAYYRGLWRHHRLHHFRNERYWLGITSNTGDRLLRTLPKDRADVPLSDTARTLGAVDAA